MSTFTREALVDLTDRALHLTQFDMRLGGETRTSRIAFIEYLSGRVLERKCDCDEYRILLKFAKS